MAKVFATLKYNFLKTLWCKNQNLPAVLSCQLEMLFLSSKITGKICLTLLKFLDTYRNYSTGLLKSFTTLGSQNSGNTSLIIYT